MSRNRFQLLLRFSHLNDSKLCKKRGQPGYDPLFKIRPFMESLQQHFKNCYNLYREVSVESMIDFKGRLWLIQYMPKKPTKWGMKAFILADRLSGYTYSWKLYAGKNNNSNIQIYKILYIIGKDDSLCSDNHSPTEAIVLKLVEDLHHRGHHLYCDNYYSSPHLFQTLKSIGFECCGTVRTNRKRIPKDFLRVKGKHKMKKGEV